MRTRCTFGLWVISIVFAALATAEDRRTDPSQLTIMTLNAVFLWDGLEPEDGSPQVTFPHKGKPELATKHMEAIAELIRAGNADIVNVDEVENLDALQMLNERFLDGMGYKAYLIDGTDTFTGQDIGLLTRIDPDYPLSREQRKRRSGSTAKAVSKNYVARFTIGGDRVAILSVHFLSRPSDTRRQAEREAQANAIHMAAMDLQAEGYEVVILGDINDYDGNPDSSDHKSSQPIT